MEGTEVFGPAPTTRGSLGEAPRTRAMQRLSYRQIGMLTLTHSGALLALVRPTGAVCAAALVTYLLTGFGISLGFHRGLAHGAFGARRGLMRVLSLLGTLAFQGGPISWIGFHRAHHRFTEGHGDPHSASRGFFWAHMGWALYKGPNGYRRQKLKYLTKSLERDPWLRFLERHHFALNASLFALTLALGGINLALWAFPLRIVALWHVTWCTNSIAHGAHVRADGAANSGPRNVTWLSIIGFGEGLHKNHHAAPSRPSFAAQNGEIDPGFWVLSSLARLGWVRLPASKFG